MHVGFWQLHAQPISLLVMVVACVSVMLSYPVPQESLEIRLCLSWVGTSLQGTPCHQYFLLMRWGWGGGGGGGRGSADFNRAI